HPKQITRMVFVGKTPSIITCSGDGTAKMFNVDNGGAQRTFNVSKDFLYAVSCSDDGDLIAVGGEDGLVKIFNGKNGQVMQTMAPPGVLPETPPKK
ncbi:MAG: NB-ARC domain protein, partial [Gemmataceae bacterium]